MSTKIRVFISSTMRDLANERDAVVRRVGSFNFEPVNAESWLPHGTRTWERIEKEIESSHLFVLILGERYGFVPDAGPGAGAGLSATHMEARRARELGLPVLVFAKRLAYDSPRGTEEASLRDRFREEVSGWGSGFSAAEFELASDLADKVGAALVEVLSESYLASAVRARAEAAREAAEKIVAAAPAPPVRVPPTLVRYAVERELTLLAGAGISLAAGSPSRRAMVELFNSHLHQAHADPGVDVSTLSFQEIASSYELVYGRVGLLNIFKHAMKGPLSVGPTEAHRSSVRLCKRIITANFDTLFEAACDTQGIAYEVIEDDEDIRRLVGPEWHELLDLPERRLIFKLSGSLTDPERLILTQEDVWDAQQRRPMMWRVLLSLLRRLPLLVVGSSLRDLAIRRLFFDARRGVLLRPGYIVSPRVDAFEERWYRRLNLEPVEATADAFFRALVGELERLPPDV